MSYMHINNLYKNKDLLLFKDCYAMEKIHGTSAHLSFIWEEKTGGIDLLYFSGGEKHTNFKKLFDNEDLLRKFAINFSESITIFGEAYGGKREGMSDTYGKELKFIAFEVRIGTNWLSVPQAEDVCKYMGIEFVHYEIVPTDITLLDKLANFVSIQGIRNGMGNHLREGIVLRPLIEVRTNNGERIIAKHKNDKFKERIHQPKLTQAKLEVMTEASQIADEWVTEMRLNHILDKFSELNCIEHTGKVIIAMTEDIIREAKDEIIDNKLVRSYIGKRTAQLFKRRLKNG